MNIYMNHLYIEFICWWKENKIFCWSPICYMCKDFKLNANIQKDDTHVLPNSDGTFMIFFLRIRPSRNCGPYQGYENSYQVITNRFDAWSEESSVFQEILVFLASPQFLACVLVALW